MADEPLRNESPRRPPMMPPPDLNTIINRLEHPDPHWHVQAPCRGLPVDLFYPERGENTAPIHAVCDGCPVRADCLADAIARDDLHGHWGGTSEVRRKRVIKAVRAVRPDLVPEPLHGQPRSDRPVAQCGTLSGYNRHRREGTPTCRDCRDIHNARKADNAARRRLISSRPQGEEGRVA
jgi:hypothetical protein